MLVCLKCTYSKYIKIQGVNTMADYAKMYYTLFGAITDALKLLEADDILAAVQTLMEAQQQTEEIYISAADETAI